MAWDDLTGMSIDGTKVREARRKGIEYVREKEVYKKIPGSVAISKGWKVIRARWKDINQGDDQSPIDRSRWVGNEFDDGEMNGIFAGAPPLEALRYLLHEAATCEGSTQKVIMVNDVARAFFEAKATRAVC